MRVVVKATFRSLYLQERDSVPILWALGLVWTDKENLHSLSGFKPRIIQQVTSRYTTSYPNDPIKKIDNAVAHLSERA